LFGGNGVAMSGIAGGMAEVASSGGSDDGSNNHESLHFDVVIGND
jgi:hypothetical protein